VKRRAAGQENQVSNQQIGNVADEFFDKFTVGTSDETNCSVKEEDTLFSIFTGVEPGKNGNPDIVMNKFINKEKKDFITEINKPTTK